MLSMVGTCEDEEGCAVGDDAAVVVSHAVDDGSHAVFPHTEPEVPLGRGVLLEVTEGLHEGHVAGCQICRSSHKSCSAMASKQKTPQDLPERLTMTIALSIDSSRA